MYCSDIQITDNQKVFYVGDTITGAALVTVPKDMPLSSVSVSFHCRIGVKWINVADMVHYLHNHIYYEKDDILHQEFDIDTSNAMTRISNFQGESSKNITIPFSFTIPKDKELPSSIVSSEGCVKYFICLTLKLRKEDTKKFFKELTVLAPFYKNLMITVGATAEKSVLLHNGTVSLHASIGRKGFAAGETITVHMTVHNQTNTTVMPKISLYQTQIYSSGSEQRIIENIMEKEPITGDEIGPHTNVEELLNVKIPENESLSIKSSHVTVKYFIHVTLDIPHSFDLHVNLPLVVTTKTVIEQLQHRKDDQMISN